MQSTHSSSLRKMRPKRLKEPLFSVYSYDSVSIFKLTRMRSPYVAMMVYRSISATH